VTSFDDQAAPDDQSAAAGQPTPDDQATPDDEAGAGYQAAVDYEPFADYAATDATRAEPAAGPDPLFASWYRQDNPTETVQVTPTEPLAPPQEYQQPQGYQQPGSQGGPSGPPFPAARPPQENGRRGLFAVIAVVLVLAAGGGAYALASSLGKHPAAQPTPSATGQAGTASGQAGPASATASPAASLVSIGPGVASSAAEPAVETLLSRYFDGIDKHDYPEYAATLTPAEQAKQTQSEFDSGYATTTDSGMTLTSLTGDGSGSPVATVTFTSRQSPAKSVDGSACNDWTLSLYLVPQGSGYLIGPAPSSYKPSYSDC
jgi:hypothetical protein